MAGTIDKTRAALVAKFLDGWSAVAPAAIPVEKVEMPNRKFDRGTSKTWARLSVRFTGRENAAIGGAKRRTRGILYLQAFVPEGSGTKALTDAGDAFAAVFDNATIPHASGGGHVVCSAMNIHETGNREGYEQMTFGVSFYSDDNR